MKSTVLIGRIFFSLIFLNTLIGHFSSSAIGYAEASGVPFSSVLVPLSGIIAFLGGISILLGFKARAGAWLIVLFLIPVTLMMHNFWAFEGAEAQTQMANFMKNIALLGGAFIIIYFGAGPLSIDSRMKKGTTISDVPARREKYQPKFTREESKVPERTEARRREKEKADGKR